MEFNSGFKGLMLTLNVETYFRSMCFGGKCHRQWYRYIYNQL